MAGLLGLIVVLAVAVVVSLLIRRVTH